MNLIITTGSLLVRISPSVKVTEMVSLSAVAWIVIAVTSTEDALTVSENDRTKVSAVKFIEKDTISGRVLSTVYNVTV